MLYYVIDLGLRKEDPHYITFLSEEDFEESLNFNLDAAIEYKDMTEEEAEEEIDKFNSTTSGEYESEINGFIYGISDYSKEEILTAYDIQTESVEDNAEETLHEVEEISVEEFEEPEEEESTEEENLEEEDSEEEDSEEEESSEEELVEENTPKSNLEDLTFASNQIYYQAVDTVSEKGKWEIISAKEVEDEENGLLVYFIKEKDKDYVATNAFDTLEEAQEILDEDPFYQEDNEETDTEAENTTRTEFVYWLDKNGDQGTSEPYDDFETCKEECIKNNGYSVEKQITEIDEDENPISDMETEEIWFNPYYDENTDYIDISEEEE